MRQSLLITNTLFALFLYSSATASEVIPKFDDASIPVLNEELRGLDARLSNIEDNKIGFSVHKNGTNQTGVVTATWTKVTWPTEEYDEGAIFKSDKFTPASAGIYQINAAIQFTVLVTLADYRIAVYKNGVAYKLSTTAASGTGGQGVNISVTVKASKTDYFEIFAYQASGVNQAIDGASTVTFFQSIKIID